MQSTRGAELCCSASTGLLCSAAEPHCLWGAGIAGVQVLVLTRAWGQQTPSGSWGHRGPLSSTGVTGSSPAPLKSEANKGPFVKATLSPHGSRGLGALNFTHTTIFCSKLFPMKAESLSLQLGSCSYRLPPGSTGCSATSLRSFGKAAWPDSSHALHPLLLSLFSCRSHYSQPQSHCSLYSPPTAIGAWLTDSCSLLGFPIKQHRQCTHLEQPQLPACLTAALLSSCTEI